MSSKEYEGKHSYTLFPTFFEKIPQNVQEKIKKLSTKNQKNFHAAWQKKSAIIPNYTEKIQNFKLYSALEQGLYVYCVLEDSLIKNVLLECLYALFTSKEIVEENLYISSIKILPFLCLEQFSILAFLFVITETSRTFFTHKEFVNFLQKSIVDLYNPVCVEEKYFSLLEISNLLYRAKTKHQLITTLRHHYTVFFDKGFNTLTISSFPEYKSLKKKKFIIRSFTNSAYEQFGFLNKASLEHHINTDLITEKEYHFILDHSEKTLMNLEESRLQLIKILPEMKEIIDAWHTSPYQEFQVSLLGKILAIAYLKSLGHPGYSFATWIEKNKK